MPLTLLDLSEAKGKAGKRLMAPANMTAILGGGGYGGFQASKTGRLNADWPTFRKSADQDLQFGLAPLRARARERAINSPIGAKFLQMLRTNVVGAHGIRINFMLEKQRVADPNDAQDEATNDALRKAWRKWCRKEYCTVHGRYTWTDVLNLAVDAAGRDGDFPVRKVYMPKSQNPFGFSLQILDADQIKDTLNRPVVGGTNQIRMGVEVDQYQKPIAYHLYGGNPFEVGGSSQTTRVPADQIYFWFIPRRAGQTRGYPLLAPVLWDMHMLDKYFDATLTAARTGAQIFGAIQQKEDEAYEGDGENLDGTAQLEVPNGTLAVLPPGQVLNALKPEQPTAAFSPFVERALRLVASGLGVQYHELGSDLSSVNLSSLRGGNREARDYYMELQNSLINALCRPVYEDWIRSALLNQAVALPFDPDRYTDEESIEFMPRRWPYDDPLKDVQADIDQIQNGFATREEKAHQQGKDWRATFRQLKAEQDYADELGLVLGTDIRGDALSEENDAQPAASAAGGKPPSGN